jgi:hypothetical protein
VIAETATVTLWVTLATALGSGVIGAGVTAFLQGRHERAERWRDRVISAALAFQEPLVDAFGAYTRAVQYAQSGKGDGLPDWSIGVDKLNDARRKKDAMLLLLGSHSPAFRAGAHAVAAIDSVNAEMLQPEDGLRNVEAALAKAAARVAAFADEANREIWSRPRRRPGETFGEYFERVGDPSPDIVKR